MMTARRVRSAGWVVGAMAVLTAMGCAGGPGLGGGGVRGHVISGPASVALSVDDTDTRLEEAGLVGVKVDAEMRPENGPTVRVGRATSGEDGSFSLKISEPKALKGQVWITASAEGYRPFRGPVYLPASGRTLLVVLDPVASAAASAGQNSAR